MRRDKGFGAGQNREINSTSRLASAALAAVAVTLSCLPARGGSVFWMNDNSGDWLDPTNWSSDPALPGPTDDVTINRLPANPMVTLGGLGTQVAVNNLTIANPLSIQGASLGIASTLTLNNTLTLEGGTISGGTINGGAAGAILLSRSPTDLYLSTLDGLTLNAPVTVNATSRLNLRGAWRNNGTITVLNNGQLWLEGTVGTDAFGTIAAPAGGVYLGGTFDNTGRTLALTDSTGSWQLGAFNEPYGTIVGGTIATSGNASLIGWGGTLDGVTLIGSLQIRDGTVTVSHDLTLDHATISLGGSNPWLKFDGNGTEALKGTGTIGMSSGSVLVVPNVPPGVSVSGTGSVFGSAGVLSNQGTISTSGANSDINVNQLMNAGLLDVSSGGTIQVQQLANFSNGTLSGGTYATHGNRSTLVLYGADITTNDANIVLDGVGSGISNDSAGTNALAHVAATGGGGSFTVTNGRSFGPTAQTYTNAGLLSVGSQSSFTAISQLTNTGTISGTGSIAAHLTNAGVITPGDTSTGILTARGVLTQSDLGALNLRIGGLSAGSDYDQLNVNGGLVLNGTLNVALVNGFTPAVSDTFQVLKFQAESGGFGTLNLPSLPAGRAWDTSRLYSDGVLAVGSTPASGTPNANPLPAAFARPPAIVTGIHYGTDPTANGFDNYWANPAAEGDFAYFNNWADQIPPSAADTAVFNSGSNGHTIHFTTDSQTHGLAVGNDTVTFDLGGHQYTVDNGSPFQNSVTVGLSTSNSHLAITHGTLAPNNYMSVGFASGSNASVSVTGAEAHLVANTLRIGDGGQGEVDVIDGASVVATFQTSVGSGSHSVGTVRITGPGSSWTSLKSNANVVIGAGTVSQGALYVADGGIFQTTNGLFVALVPGSTGLVEVSGVSGTSRSTLTFGGGPVGNAGSGTLHVANGALVTSSGSLAIGSSFGSTGTAIVGGSSGGFNAELSAGQILIADNESGLPSAPYSGSLTVNTGGKVTVVGGIMLGNGETGTGTLAVVGGQVVSGPLAILGGSAAISGGSLAVNGNTANYRSFVQTGGSAALQTVTGTGSVSVVGVDSPASLEAVSINQSSLTVGNNATATLLPGPTAATSIVSSLSITGSGRLNLTNNNLIVQYTPANSTASAIEQYLARGYNGGAWNGPGIGSTSATGSISIGFADAADAGITGLQANSVVVKLAVVGDANLDGRVNFADLLDLSQQYGRPIPAWDAGDFNYDGSVGFDDLLLLVQHYGESVPAVTQISFTGDAAALTQVPESGLSPILLGAVFLYRRRTVRR